jgi:hypothetical protein
MEITLLEALKKFFIRDKLIILLIMILSFGLYPFVEKKYFHFKNIDYLLIRIDLNTFEKAYSEIAHSPIKYLDRLQTITSREKSDRNQYLNKLDCRGFIGPRKYDVDCHFFIRLNENNREEEIKKYINYIKEDYRNYQLDSITPHIMKLKKEVEVKFDEFEWQEKMGIDPNLMHYYDKIYNYRNKIGLLEKLYSTIKNEDSKSLFINHKILEDQKDTLFNSILIFVMLSFINFCRVILIN